MFALSLAAHVQNPRLHTSFRSMSEKKTTSHFCELCLKHVSVNAQANLRHREVVVVRVVFFFSFLFCLIRSARNKRNDMSFTRTCLYKICSHDPWLLMFKAHVCTHPFAMCPTKTDTTSHFCEMCF